MFFGIISNAPTITRVDVWSATTGEQVQGERATVIDNVTLAHQVVPEPGTVILVATGLLILLGGAARGRQRV